MATSLPPSPFRYLALAVVLLCFSMFVCGANLPAAEVATLRKIAKSLGKIWNFNVDPCSGLSGWNITHATDSVTCDCTFFNNTVCHVTNIRLKSQSLPGFLPPELAELRFLQEIDLTRNYLNGTIPPEWGSTRLVNITLLGNRLSGSIPKEFGNISTLSSLVLEINQLSGPLPPELGTLSSIKRMFLTSNNFTGHIPSTFANLTTLEDFRLGDNFFSGKIPNFIQNWINLDKLVLQGSGLAGPIPSGISLLANLTDLRITDLNGTEEALFPSLESMKLKTLILRSCNIVGELPYYLGHMTSLKTLDLSFNKLSGMIPESFSSDKIQYIYFTGNSLNGTVPDWMLRSSKKVDISYNNFALGNTTSSCPPQKLNFFGNSLVSNTVGTALCSNAQCPNKTTFFHINCGGSSYNNGSIIFELDRDTSGPSSYYLSPSNWALSNSGHFLDNTTTSEGYILIANQSALSTGISQLDMDARVSAISLTYYGFCLENGNYKIDLYFAETAFTSDNTYRSLGRRVFDVYIQGKLELKDFNIAAEAGGNGKGIIKKFVSYVPNGTLEIRLQWAGKGTTAIPYKGVYGPLVSAISATNHGFVTDNGLSSTGAIVGIIISVLVVLVLVMAFLWWKFQHVRMADDLKGSLDLQSGSFTLRQLRAATNNFDPAYKIGEGGFGPVFKGYLSDGTIIAVKQLSSDSNQGNREFVNEIGMISALRHPNLVKLYGCCVEGNQLLLVYEYMANNSLARALFADFKESDLHLDWPTRYKICIGIARGLSYLHEESALKIVHRDIKATNVLLDTDLTPKISDFGLAKLDEDENTHISTRIAGTFGYMAPEYATRGYLTDKADVYSFGIVALEIVCGRSNTSYKANNEPFYILDWVLILKEKEQLMDVIDPRLKGDFNKDQVMTVIKIGLLCTDASPTSRPAMSLVVSILEGETNAVDSVTAHSSMQTNEKTSVEVDPVPYGEDSLVDSQVRSDGPWSCTSTSIPDLYPVIPDSDYWQKRDCT